VRRGISIFLLVLFWLGPLAAMLPASDDFSLPACCRREGAHHCAMSMDMAATASAPQGSSAALTAPRHCSNYPCNRTAWTTPVHALTVSFADLPLPFARAHKSALHRADPLSVPISPLSGRGPPAIPVS